MRNRVSVMLLGLMGLLGVAGYSLLRAPSAPWTPSQAMPVAQVHGESVRGSSPTIFEIDPSQSEARFVTSEILLGVPNEVVGATNQISGQIVVNPTDPDAAQIGTIQINARTLATDDSQRNRMLQRVILDTDRHEFITFTPRGLHGRPDITGLGEPHSFLIDGELTIRDVTRDVVFSATVTPRAEDLIADTATITINYSDWGVTIPSVPFVASVDPQVRLELSFVASPAA